jgi:hypothetical protein
LNPILEEIDFWKNLERFNEKYFGLKRRLDPTVKVAVTNTVASTKGLIQPPSSKDVAHKNRVLLFGHVCKLRFRQEAIFVHISAIKHFGNRWHGSRFIFAQLAIAVFIRARKGFLQLGAHLSRLGGGAHLSERWIHVQCSNGDDSDAEGVEMPLHEILLGFALLSLDGFT